MRPNIWDEVASICAKLGLEPNDVARLNLFPDRVEAMIFAKNENGSKYIDLERNVPAVEWRNRRISTVEGVTVELAAD